MTSFKIAYFTVKSYGKNNFIEWDWLESQALVHETKYIKLVKVSKPIEISVDGKSGIGVALKGY